MQAYQPLVLLHIGAGAVSILTGFIALYATKGAPLHRRLGTAFVVAMLAMASLALLAMAVYDRINLINVVVSLLTGYFVITSLVAVRPLAFWTPRVTRGAMLVAAVVVLFSFVTAYVAFTVGNGWMQGIPAPVFILFGVLGTFGVIGDARMLRAGPYTGKLRLARHLWRMTLALLIAAFSFFIGQADELPKALRIPAVLILPEILILGALFYWLWRVRFRGSLRGLVGIRENAQPAP